MNYKAKQTFGKIGLIALLCVPLVSCGRSSTKSKGEKLRQNDFSLNGTWNNGCGKTDWLGLSHEKTTLKFSPLGDFDRMTTFYSDAECKQGTAKLVERGTYASLDKTANVPEARDINFTLVAADMSALSDDSVKLMNTASYCEKADWKVGTSTDVLGKKCLGMNLSSGNVIFDIYHLDGSKKQLTFGRDQIFLDKSDAQSRPDKLNSERLFTKES